MAIRAGVVGTQVGVVVPGARLVFPQILQAAFQQLCLLPHLAATRHQFHLKRLRNSRRKIAVIRAGAVVTRAGVMEIRAGAVVCPLLDLLKPPHIPQALHLHRSLQCHQLITRRRSHRRSHLRTRRRLPPSAPPQFQP